MENANVGFAECLDGFAGFVHSAPFYGRIYRDLEMGCSYEIVSIATMVRSCASAAKLRAAGPILAVGICAMSAAGSRHFGSSIGSPP